MITSKNITKKQIKRILQLIKQCARAEAMARHGEFGRSLEFADFYLDFIERRDKLRKYIYGTSDLVKLGIRWGILKSNEQVAEEKATAAKKKTRGLKKKKKKQRELF
jgi:hypothetical protein